MIPLPWPVVGLVIWAAWFALCVAWTLLVEAKWVRRGGDELE
jgi:hypothetical protein